MAKVWSYFNIRKLSATRKRRRVMKIYGKYILICFYEGIFNINLIIVVAITHNNLTNRISLINFCHIFFKKHHTSCQSCSNASNNGSLNKCLLYVLALSKNLKWNSIILRWSRNFEINLTSSQLGYKEEQRIFLLWERESVDGNCVNISVSKAEIKKLYTYLSKFFQSLLIGTFWLFSILFGTFWYSRNRHTNTAGEVPRRMW